MINRRTVERLLINRPMTQPDKWAGTIAGVDPLRVRVRQAIPDATPDTLVSGLAVGESVWGETVSGRMVILGRFSGTPLVTAEGLITPAAGFTVVHCHLARVGRLAQIALRVQRDVDTPAGDHSNVTVGTLDPGWWPAIQTPLSSATAGASLGALATIGVVEISSTVAATPAGSAIDLYGTYITAN